MSAGFTSPRLGPLGLVASLGYVAVMWALLLAVDSQQQPSRVPFMLSSLLAGLMIGRWAAALLPVVAVTTYVALGLPASPGDALGAALLVGTIGGVALRRALASSPVRSVLPLGLGRKVRPR